MKKSFIPFSAILMGICSVFSAQAEITFNGFGSVVAGVETDSDVFRNSPYTDDIDFKPQSKFALQASAPLGEGLSATVQIMSRGENDFDVNFEWAYLSYELNDNNTLRAGRLRIPFYKYSDYLDVGYAYPWINPPKTMYSLLFSTYDGLSLVSNFNWGNVDVSSNIIYGNVNDTFFATTFPTEGKLNNLYGANVTFSYDAWSWFVAYMNTKVNIPREQNDPGLGGLYNGLVQLAGSDKASLLIIDDDKGTFLGTGLTYDSNNWLFNAEWSTVEVKNSLISTTKNWYASLGYRLGKWMPHLTYGKAKSDRNTAIAANFNGIMFPLNGNMVPANLVVQNVLDSQLFEYTSITAGVKYDLTDSAVLKVEYSRFSDIYDASSSTGLGTPDDKASTGLFAVGIDFVF
ncbi:porin [Neptunicella sp.]|uniref:porin n=1 Tax=Neptunicella sp. TaxID=2125986 RepID=UPI003F68ED15